MWNRGLWLIVMLGLVTGCAGKKKVVLPSDAKTPIATNSSNNAYLINNLNYTSFTGRAKTKVEFGDTKQDATLNIRLQRDKAIWISVTATLFNYEAARVLITPDSVKIMNKLQGEYIAKPFNYIHKYTGAGVTFTTLQDVVIGNVSRELLNTDQMTVANTSDETQLVGLNEELSFQYSLNAENRPKVFRLVVQGKKGNLASYYGGYNKVGGYNFPHNQQITIQSSGMKISALLDYVKVDFNQVLDFPFSVPDRYQKIQ